MGKKKIGGILTGIGTAGYMINPMLGDIVTATGAGVKILEDTFEQAQKEKKENIKKMKR